MLKSLDAGGALNSGLISYSVGGEQYVAAAVGGPTENPSAVAGPLRVSIFGLQGSDKPKVVQLDRLGLLRWEPSPRVKRRSLRFAANATAYQERAAAPRR